MLKCKTKKKSYTQIIHRQRDRKRNQRFIAPNYNVYLFSSYSEHTQHITVRQKWLWKERKIENHRGNTQKKIKSNSYTNPCIFQRYSSTYSLLMFLLQPDIIWRLEQKRHTENMLKFWCIHKFSWWLFVWSMNVFEYDVMQWNFKCCQLICIYEMRKWEANSRNEMKLIILNDCTIWTVIKVKLVSKWHLICLALCFTE